MSVSQINSFSGLMVDNCHTFNGPGIISESASMFWDVFEKEFKKVKATQLALAGGTKKKLNPTKPPVKRYM